MDRPEIEGMFDDKLNAAGAALEATANMSALTNHLLFQARDLIDQAELPGDDPRRLGLRTLIDIFEGEIAPAFALATQKDPTGARGTAAMRPWRDPELARA